MTRHLSQWLLVIGGSVELSLVVKATIALAAGLLAVRVARRARAATRHQILASMFVGLLMLPAIAWVLPATLAFTIAVPIRNAVSNPIAATDAGAAAANTADTAGAGHGDAVGASVNANAGANANAEAVAGVRARTSGVIAQARLVWIAGTSLLLLWLGVALWRFDRLRRRGLPWLASRSIVMPLAAAAGVRRDVEVLLHEDLVAPATCGWRRPTILLPADAPNWNAADLRRALVHELEHVRRGDWAFQHVAFVTCAAFWFHPLAWMALRRLRLEAERACDDAVLQGADVEQADYAEQLVQLARRLSGARTQPTLAMAGRSDLSTRVSAILDSTQSRGRLGSMPAAFALLASTALVVAVAPVRAIGVDDAIGGIRCGVTGGGVAGIAGGVPKAIGGGVIGGVTGGVDPQQAPSGRVRRGAASDSALYEAAEAGDVKEIAALIAAGANVNAQIGGDGSPLIGAARGGSLAAVTMLLDQGADPNLAVSGDGNPIIMAAREGHAEIVELLLNRGAHIDQVVPGDENALIQASGAGQLTVVKLLLARGADVNARVWVEKTGGRDSRGEWRTPLNMARRGGHRAVVDYLVSAGARDN